MSETTSTPNKETISCWLCDELEQGDTLYQYGADDVGMAFNYIRDVRFCPLCGRRLLTYEQKYRRKG